jgi:membrane protein
MALRLGSLAFLRTLARLLLTAARGYSQHGCSLLAAAISYYVMFSLFPLLIFAAGVAALILRDPDLQRRAIDAILDALPLNPIKGRQDLEDLFRTISGPTSGGIGLLGLVGSAWSASNMLAAVRRSLDVVFETPSRPLVRGKLADFTAMAALSLLGFVEMWPASPQGFSWQAAKSGGATTTHI